MLAIASNQSVPLAVQADGSLSVMLYETQLSVSVLTCGIIIAHIIY